MDRREARCGQAKCLHLLLIQIKKARLLERNADVVSKHSSRTITASGALVPWLAAAGPLAYSPEDPPSRDYYFQYGWVLPDVLNPASDRKRHRFFGAGFKSDADELFAFWNNARAGDRTRLHLVRGRAERRIAERKFGPNFVVCKTPLTNIRITTFFAREAEAKVIDPNKVHPVEKVGCEWSANRAPFAQAAVRSRQADPAPGRSRLGSEGNV